MDNTSYTIRVPKRWGRIAAIVGVLALIAAPLTAAATNAFSDVPTDHTHHDDITWLKSAAVTKGCNPPANSNYCPDDDVTRAQMATFMRNLAKYMGAEDGTPAQADNAAEADLANAVASGVVGSDELEDNEPFKLIGASGQPSFQNGWANFGGGFTQAGFFKDHQDIVYLKGTITGGASGTTAFTLPAGYRPSQSLFLPLANGDFGYVQANGAVVLWYNVNVATSNGDIGLDGLSFRIGVGGASVPPTGTPGQ